MNYLSDSIERARLQAAEDDFSTWSGGAAPAPEEAAEETPEEEAQGLVFDSRSFENVPKSEKDRRQLVR